MKIVVSPAKSLNFETLLPTEKYTQPVFLEEASKLNGALSRKSKKAIGELMHISDALATLNKDRYNQFQTPFTTENARPAVYTFDGDVYQGLDIFSLPEKKIDKLQDSLRILSGMYGVLKPLDLMQAYRLEMGTKLKVGRADNLYKFWGDTVTQKLNEELTENELFINLASNEYFKVVNQKLLKTPIITPVFKDFKNGKLKVISFFAKKARGRMVRYILDKNVQTIEDLLGFDYDDYRYSEEHSKPAKNEFTFIR
jgi:cytoplasmic iron level regulating protein YaaA (DUF328/UPF0246 family)